MEHVTKQLNELLLQFEKLVTFKPHSLVVIGASTSEVIGEKIGTSGAIEVAKALYEPLANFEKRTGAALAFQCCEHLNRALVIDEAEAEKRGYEQVAVIPVPNAGGSMAAYAFERMKNPVVVEEIKADAGIDIGNTMIGMHLKRVAVPLRASIRWIGEAYVTLATTRPKLIGGERACYKARLS
ncbi:TIGR01440 family protein [Pueribacillus theae]|uniref:UPF0340 protein DCC39_08855 n=1 Tax=Pueribacillus theae TaxID=2171751 RepID=A0A2U1K2Z9_9BACI|nr:TIGR01440 family protein [Pueribacillus theae]PWA11886.1 TIGR01440 family protein [Pueribacillus theae]